MISEQMLYFFTKTYWVYIYVTMWQDGYSGGYIAAALVLGLLVGVAVVVLVLFVVYRVIGRSPYACLDRSHDGTSTTPASVCEIIRAAQIND